MKYDSAQFKRALMGKGWSQKTLARKAGLSQATVCDFLNGKNQSPETAKKLADKLGIDLANAVVETEQADAPMPLTPKAEREALRSSDAARERIAR